MPSTSTTITSWALLVWITLQEHGFDSFAIFKEAGLDHTKLGNGQARYRLDEMTRLWTIAVRETGDPCFGAEVGKHWTPTTFHALGFAWLASNTLKDALQRFTRYTRIVNNSLTAKLETHGANIHLVMETSEDESKIHSAARDAGMTAVITMCRLLCGNDFSPTEMHVSRDRPKCHKELEKFVGCQIEFNAEQNQSLFDRISAEKHLPTGNSELVKVNEDLAMKYLVKLDGASIMMQVKARLIEMMPRGHVSEEAIATQMNLSLRTLQRKLREENTSYSQIYKSIRQEMAGEYIQNPQMSMTEIAYLLGFSEQANFTRAFRRWYGTSPSAARENIQKTSVLQ